MISDIAMPGEDGYRLLENVRKMESSLRHPPVPAIALTAYARDEDRKNAAAAGFDMHLAKPIEPDELIDTIVRALSKRVGKAS
jgi:CheY-like chemotaxis protein